MDPNSNSNNNNNTNTNNNNANASRPNEAFNFDYTLPINNDVYQNLMMSDGALFGTTAAIPDNLFEFITNNNPTGQFDPAVQFDPAATNSVVNNNLESVVLPGQQQTADQRPPAAPSVAVAGQKRTRQDEEDEQAQPQQTCNSVCTAPSSNTKSIDDDGSQYEPPKQAMFAIVVGGRPFRLSWESIKSDGPQNFFTEFFRRRKTTRIMHVDRDPDVFYLVVQHLRGYYVQPHDQLQHQALLSDANYYGLKRLRAFLLQYLYVNVGGRIFRLPWSLFKKDGESTNYFTGPIRDLAFIPNGNGIQTSPFYIDRDPDLFEDIINHLRGYSIRIRDELHRKNLIKDAQYYAFTHLRDKLLVSREMLDGLGDQECLEVLLYLHDVRPMNLIRSKEEEKNKSISSSSSSSSDSHMLQYKRGGTPHALLVQLSDFRVIVRQANSNDTERRILSAELTDPHKRKLRELSQGISLNGVDDTHVMLDDACAMTVDDRPIRHLEDLKELDSWRRCDASGSDVMLQLGVQRAIARLQVVDERIVLCLLRFEAISSRFELNMKREFLSG